MISDGARKTSQKIENFSTRSQVGVIFRVLFVGMLLASSLLCEKRFVSSRDVAEVACEHAALSS